MPKVLDFPTDENVEAQATAKQQRGTSALFGYELIFGQDLTVAKSPLRSKIPPAGVLSVMAWFRQLTIESLRNVLPEVR